VGICRIVAVVDAEIVVWRRAVAIEARIASSKTVSWVSGCCATAMTVVGLA
jgi:hypothetical protein